MASPCPTAAGAPKRRRVTQKVSHQALEALAAQQQSDMFRLQLEWVTDRLKEDPSLMPRVMGALRAGEAEQKPYFPDCVRRFNKVKKDRIIELLHQLEPSLKQVNFSNVGDIDQLRWLLVWALACSMQDKIPFKKKEGLFVEWAVARYAAAGRRLRSFVLPPQAGNINFLTQWGAFFLQKPEESSSAYTHIVHAGSNDAVELPSPIPCEALPQWTIADNYADTTAKLCNRSAGTEQKLAVLFSKQVEQCAQAPVPDEAGDDGANAAVAPMTPQCKPNSSPTKGGKAQQHEPSPHASGSGAAASAEPGKSPIASPEKTVMEGLSATLVVKSPSVGSRQRIAPPPPPVI